MFGMGVTEIVTILVIMIVFISPADWPHVARKIGKIYGRIVKQVNKVRKAFDEYEEEIRSVTDMNSSDNS